MAEKDSIYKLRCSLNGHSMDVRAVTVTPKGEIITASRDKTTVLWAEISENCLSYEQKVVYVGHTGYVMSVCVIPGNETSPEGFTATGSKDSTILIFSRYSPQPVHTLTGHTDAVSCLAWKNDLLVSGSWDRNLRVWKDWECLVELTGHSGPVWSVAFIQTSKEECFVLSASADKTLKCWKDSNALVTYTGHTDCVRGIAVLDSKRFLSCSNDASIRLWAISGECLATYQGHTSFIYSIFCGDSSSGEFVTGGEDRSARVWDSQGNNCHTILLPAQSIWAVASLPNSDVVVGSSDSVCRVFSRNVDRQTKGEELAQFEKSLANFKVAVEDIGGIKKSDLPDKTILLMPGKRDGQTIMVRDGDKILCYNWSAAKGEWEAVGEVVGGAGGSAGTSGKVLHLGKEYDYVFDVDLDEGRCLKLPYNRGEDPWVVAQGFIHRNQLPQDHLTQVANFVIKNANVTSSSIAQQNSAYYDPFTGGSRYIPGGTPSVTNTTNNLLAGSSQNIPSFTQETRTPSTTSQYFPQTVPLSFETVNKTGMMSKLKESNDMVTDPLSAEEVEALVEAVLTPNVNISALSPLEKALQWPAERVWPALDILRLALRSEAAQERWLGQGKGDAIVGLLVSFIGPPIPALTQLLALRCLTNMASHTPGQKLLAGTRNSVLPSAISITPFPNKNIEIAVATLFINYSIIFTKSKDLEDYCQLLSAMATVALSATDPEAQFRNLVAIGTSLCADKDVRSLAHSLDMEPIIEKLALADETPKVSECARHVLKHLKP